MKKASHSWRRDLEKNGKVPSQTDVIVLEIGAYAGASAIQWGRSLKALSFRLAKVFSVDPWEGYFDLQKNRRFRYRIMNRALNNGTIFDLFKWNIHAAGVSDICDPIVGNSESIRSRFGEHAFDVIYIDGDHDYEAVKRDIRNVLPLLKDGGVL